MVNYSRCAALMCVGLIAVPAMAQPAPRIKATKEEYTSPLVVEVRGGTGIGVFQDIQVPANDAAQMRGDGKLGAEENADHGGIALYGGAGVSYRDEAMKYDLLRLDAAQVRATTGPAETQSSTYDRLEVSTGATYSLAVGGNWLLDLGLRAGARRSSFSNVSSAHYIDAVLAGGSVSLGNDGFRIELFGAAAPMAKFGYTESAVLGGKPFSNSKAVLAEGGAMASFKIGPRARFDVGLEQEAAKVTIDDVSEYNKFGLNVVDTRRPNRAYDLATTMLRVGIRKDF